MAQIAAVLQMIPLSPRPVRQNMASALTLIDPYQQEVAARLRSRAWTMRISVDKSFREKLMRLSALSRQLTQYRHP